MTLKFRAIENVSLPAARGIDRINRGAACPCTWRASSAGGHRVSRPARRHGFLRPVPEDVPREPA